MKKSSVLLFIKEKVIKLTLLVVISSIMSGCAITEKVGSMIEPGSAEFTGIKYPNNPSQKDHWLDNAKAWRYWDLNAPYNKEVEWSFAEDALTINLSASELLNLFNGSPHSVKFKVIQFSDIAGYKVLSSSSDGIRVMLVEQVEMLPSAVFVDEMMLVPGQKVTFILDRHLDAQYVAMVFGFSNLETNKVTRLIRLPVINEQTPPSLVNKLTLGYLDASESDEAVIRVADVNLHIALAEDRISLFAAEAY